MRGGPIIGTWRNDARPGKSASRPVRRLVRSDGTLKGLPVVQPRGSIRERIGPMSISRLTVVGIAVLALAGSGLAQPPAKPVDAKELDQGINNALRDVINSGAKLYNKHSNDQAGCHRLFDGSLI